MRILAKRALISILRRTPRRSPREINAVRIFRYGGIGDLIVLTGLLQAIRRKFPAASISLVTRPGMAELFRGSPLRLTLVTRKAPTDTSNPWELLMMKLALNRGVCDVDIFLHNDVKSAIFARSLKSKYIFGLDSDDQGYGRLFDNSMSVYSRSRRNRGKNNGTIALNEFFHRAGELALGTEFERFLPRLWPMLSETGNMRERLRLRSGQRVVGIALGGSHSSKLWPVASYSRLASIVVERLRARVLVIGGPSEAENAFLFEGINGVSFLAGKLGLRESLSAVALSDIVVGNDTGMVHAAAALGRRTVALFGPTDDRVFGNATETNLIVRASMACPLECEAVCELRRDDREWKRKGCLHLERISAEQVYEKVAHLSGSLAAETL